MPALEARLNRLHAAHTMVVSASVDSHYCDAAWAAMMGGISFPILSDFHPKGAVADKFGMYLPQAGISDRAAVLIDASGKVVWTESVTPPGTRDIEAMVARAEALDAAWTGPALSGPSPSSPGLASDAVLYVRNSCMASRWAMYARDNLGLQSSLTMRNVSEDADALAALTAAGGKGQAPALSVGGKVMYEANDIVAYLADKCGQL